METLIKLREQIDSIDTELAALFEKRLAVSARIARVKLQNNLPLLDRQREAEIMAGILLQTQKKSYRGKMEKLFNVIFDLSKNLQNRIIINSHSDKDREKND